MEIQIRKIQRNELVLAAKLYQLGYRGLEIYAYTGWKTIKGYMRWLHHRDPSGFLGAFLGDRLVGFAAADSGWGDYQFQDAGAIHEIVVDPDHRRKGIGTALISGVLDHLRSKGLRYAVLWVGEHNYGAREFYRKLGFEEVGKDWWVWIKMVRSLG